MNKRGEAGSFMMFFTFLFLLLIIGGGIVAGTYMFFGKEYEFRHVDAQILNFRVSNCIMEKEIDFEDQRDFYLKCRISNDSILNNNMIIKVCRDTKECASEINEERKVIQIGGNFVACKFEGVKGNSAFPVCKENKIIKDGVEYSILTGSNQGIRKRQVNF